jgi:hypothetical protein
VSDRARARISVNQIRQITSVDDVRRRLKREGYDERDLLDDGRSPTTPLR